VGKDGDTRALSNSRKPHAVFTDGNPMAIASMISFSTVMLI
jgi:hypothetical protein